MEAVAITQLMTFQGEYSSLVLRLIVWQDV